MRSKRASSREVCIRTAAVMQANAAKRRLMRTSKAYPDEVQAATEPGLDRLYFTDFERISPFATAQSEDAVDSSRSLRIIAA